MTVFGSWVPVPGRHPANDILQGFFLVLGFIGALALLVSGFLVVNTVSAILAQQTRQIGVMKAIGARNRQIAGIYFGLVLAYALLALVVALPLGVVGAYGFTSFTAGLVNFDVETLYIPPNVIALEVVIGLVVPLAAAIWPVMRGVRTTVREALASTGISDRFGHGRFDRLLVGPDGVRVVGVAAGEIDPGGAPVEAEVLDAVHRPDAEPIRGDGGRRQNAPGDEDQESGNEDSSSHQLPSNRCRAARRRLVAGLDRPGLGCIMRGFPRLGRGRSLKIYSR